MRKLMIVLIAVGLGAGLAFGTPANPIDENSPLKPGGPEAIQSPLRAVGDPVDFDASMLAGADYLRRMQADVTEDNAGNGTEGVDEIPNDPDDGGWDWVVNTSAPFSHTTAASPPNIYGATGMGLYYAYLESGNAALFTALTDAADKMAANPGIRSGADLVFLMLYNDLPGVTGTVYQDSAKAKYDARIVAYGSAGALVAYIRDARGVTQGYPNGIIAWDIGVWGRTAAMLDDLFPGSGYDTDADAIADTLWEDSFNDNPGLFDIVDDAGWDPAYGDVNFWWYNTGITGLIDGFLAADKYTDEIPGLVSILLDGQYSGGAVSDAYGANTGDEDWQTTAYAMMTLGNLDQATYQDEINRMGYWTGATQDASGGWVYSSGNHYPEIGGENTAGLYFTTNDIIDVIVDDGFTSQADVDVYNVANSTDYVWGYDAFATIQEGINAVTGSTVNVAAGTYSGNLILPGGINLLSIGGAAVTTIAGSGGIAVTITGDDVVIDGFTITNPSGNYAISSTDNSDITISNNIVTDIGTTATTGSVHAINMVCNDTAVDGITVEDNVLHNLTGVPGKSVSAITVGHSTGTGYVTNLLIQRNAIYDIDANTSDWPVGRGAYGILLSHGTGTTGRTIDPQVLNNTIDDLEGLWAHAIGLEGYTPGAVLSGNVISNLVDHKTPSDAVAVMVESNAGAGTVSIHSNSFTNLSVGVFSTNTGEIVDALGNWWGAASGPYNPDTNPSGTGCAVGSYIAYDPWLSGNIVFNPDPEVLTEAVGTKTISVDYLGGGSGLMYGYNVSFTWDNAVVSTSTAQVIEGTLLSNQGATQWFTSQVGNTITVHNVLLGAQPGVIGPGTLFTIRFDAVSCDTSVIDLTVNAVRDNNNQPLTGFVADDGLIYVDQGLPSFTVNNPWPDSLCHATAPSLDLSADANCGDLDDAFYKYDAGVWTSDPNLFTDYAGSLWNNGVWVLPGFAGLGEGPHTVYFYCTDDFGNVSATVSWDFIKDTVDPPPVTDFASAPGHDKTHLSWTNPVSDFDHVVVVRKAWDSSSPYGYADYTQPAAGYPTDPADGVVVYNGTAEICDDDPIADRSIYFYRAFTYDCADNWTGGTAETGNVPAAFAQGDRTTSYWLGDVAGSYDGSVGYSDITVLSSTYWLADGDGGWNSECDVGPTDDWSRVGIPIPDDYINFEDLIVFAMNFGVVNAAGKEIPEVILTGSPSASTPTLRLEGSADEAGLFRARLILDGNRDEVKGMSVELTFDDALEFVSAGPSDAIGSGMAFFIGDQVAPGRVRVDLSALGTGRTIHGSGDIAFLTFRMTDENGDPSLRFDDVTLRDAENTKLSVDVDDVALSRSADVPTVTRLVGAVPNPFNPVTSIAYELSKPERVSVNIYDAQGRLVRTLVDQTQGAGLHEQLWDGRDNSGRSCASGIYLVRMSAGSYGKSAKVVMLK